MSELIVPAILESLDIITEYVCINAHQVGLDTKNSYRLRLAVDELTTNIILHGYAEAQGEILLQTEVDGAKFIVTIEDYGAPFDPHAVPEPETIGCPPEQRNLGGLGVFLTRKCVDKLHYERIASRNRNILILHNKCSPLPQPPPPAPEQAPPLPIERFLIGACHIANAPHLCSYLIKKGHPLAIADCESNFLFMAERYGIFDIAIGCPKWLQDWPSLPYAEQTTLIAVLSDTPNQDFAWVEKYAEDYLLGTLSPALLIARIDMALRHHRIRLNAHNTIRDLKITSKIADDFTQIILPLGVELSAERSFDQLMEKTLLEAKKVCNADAGTLYLREKDHLRFVIMRTDSIPFVLGGKTGLHIPIEPLPLKDPHTNAPNLSDVATVSALTRRTINISDIYHSGEYDFSSTKAFDLQIGYRSRSCLTTPMRDHTGEVIGVLQLINARDPDNSEIIAFSPYLEKVVQLLSAQAAIALNNHLLLKQREDLLRSESESEIGRQIQHCFLPEKLPQPQGWELAAYFHPSLDVGGDLYDAFYLNGSKFLGLVLGDVCDKGVGAAIFMMLLRSLVRAFAGIDADNDPCKPLSYGVSRTNEYIATHHQSLNMFATLFFAVLDPQTGKLAYINAGHPPVLLCNQWGIRAELKPTGPAVGVFPDAQFDIQHVQIQPGEMLFAYTDGVTDARNANGQSFTQERLFALLHPLAPSAQKFIDRICKAISNHSTQNTYFDDIAMLVAQRKSS